MSSLIDVHELERAFAEFSQRSAQLADSYAALQRQAEQLTRELTVKNSELRLQYQEKEALSQRLALLLEALPGGVVVLDGGGDVVEANPAARRLLGGNLVGRAWSEIIAGRLSDTSAPGEWDLDGGARRVSIVGSSLDSAGGRILLVHDVTAAHQMNRQLERHKRLSAMGEMAASLAHQLRTPLATALLYTANLTKPGIEERDRLRFADKALTRLHHLERMIGDMLTFVKGESAERQPISVRSLLSELAQIIEPQAQERGVHFELQDTSGTAWVQGNRKALLGAVLNLLENALNATPAGGAVTLCATGRGEQVVMQVADTGCGIAPEAVERLFEPFYTTRPEGTGLGLAIVRTVARDHGGEVEVESRLGKGSTFSLRLPEHLRAA